MVAEAYLLLLLLLRLLLLLPTTTAIPLFMLGSSTSFLIRILVSFTFASMVENPICTSVPTNKPTNAVRMKSLGTLLYVAFEALWSYLLACSPATSEANSGFTRGCFPTFCRGNGSTSLSPTPYSGLQKGGLACTCDSLGGGAAKQHRCS